MLFLDNEKHHKPHVHVYYGDYEASVGIDRDLLSGSIPIKQLKIINAWLAIHEDELYRAWNNGEIDIAPETLYNNSLKYEDIYLKAD